MKTFRTVMRIFFLATTSFLLVGCKHMSLLDPHGSIARAEMHLLVYSVLLMLIVVIPVIFMTLGISWYYRASNPKADYRPKWCHSNKIEAVCWGVPIVIIAILAVMTWVSTHELDPYKPIEIDGKKPVVVQVVALDWRWLFIYPEQNIATVNYFHIPINTPISLQITADAPMNSIEIPQLAGQIYAMPAMKSELHLDAYNEGVYKGFSANYSGNGFAGMKFDVTAQSDQDFNKWVATVKQANKKLSLVRYKKLAKQSMDTKPLAFSSVENRLFNYIIVQYMVPNGSKKNTMTVPYMFKNSKQQ
ncbi:MAG: ubiquinol oxidase subunit II [Coxiellaceae bacterium]|nr:ubiquinol oxidase subunit II [Coxiellaceae bacterium]